jgi:hypothetical protein
MNYSVLQNVTRRRPLAYLFLNAEDCARARFTLGQEGKATQDSSGFLFLERGIAKDGF